MNLPKLRDDFLVSICFTDATDTDQTNTCLTTLVETLRARYRYWEILIVNEIGYETLFSDTLTSIPNLRYLSVAQGLDDSQRRVVAASEAIGDIVVITSLQEVGYMDIPTMIEKAYTNDAVILGLRQAIAAAEPLIIALGRASGFQASTRDMKTVAYSRTSLNRLLNHPNPLLALRFPPRDTSLSVLRQMPNVDINSVSEPKSGISQAFTRLDLLMRMVTEAGPTLLFSVAMFSAMISFCAVLFMLYVVIVFLVKADVADGWTTLSLTVSGMLCFLGVALFAISITLRKVGESFRGGATDHLISEHSSVDLFEAVANALNVDTEGSAKDHPCTSVEPPTHPTRRGKTGMTKTRKMDYVVIGGGFYGCCLALFLRSVVRDVMLVDGAEAIMTRASRVNQARLHSGFHYPRSMMTALKSRKLCQRFATDFPDAIVSNFQMLYAVARQRSKVPANRFRVMFENMQAPIAPALPSQTALFDDRRIEAVFRVDEYAFDFSILARGLTSRIDAAGIDLRLQTSVVSIEDEVDAPGPVVHLSDGSSVHARRVFNVTYSQINHILRQSGLPLAQLKHELSEIALVDPPAEIQGFAVTVMDGPFFSLMPYPSAGKYSLTHVRYTPHISWTDQSQPVSPYDVFEGASLESKLKHMVLDAARYMPCMGSIRGGESIYDVKTVLVKNEGDDGRPILVHEEPRGTRITSILGGKIDNIYDLFSHLKSADSRLSRAHFGYGLSERTSHAAASA